MANDGTVKIGVEFETDGAAEKLTKDVEKEAKQAEKSVDSLKDGVKDLSKEVASGEKTVDNFSSGLSELGSTAASALKTGLLAVSGAATAAVGGLLALESATEEYRIAQGKLNTAFEAAGYGTDVAKQAYTEFYKILGDTDTATEASQLLAKLADNAEDVSTWTRIAAGVSGTFGDSLPIEGLIEASNETAKVGTVTGVLADALNWAGISEDIFNTKLAACTSESERNQLIMDTLAGTYDEASDAFYRNNEALVQSRENQAALDESLAKIGESVATVKNALISEFSPAISEAAEYAANFISNIDPDVVVEKIQGLISTLETLLPVITGVTAATVAYKAAVAISSIIDAVTKATEGMSIAQAALNAVMNANPFVLVATLIAGLVTALITLWNTNDDFREAVKKAWDTIKTTISSAVKSIKEFFTKTIPEAAQTALDWFKSIPDKMKDVGKNLIMGLWNGITDKVSWLKDKVLGVVDTIKGWFTGKDGFDTHSPSKWAENIGSYIDEGLAGGMERTKGAVKSAALDVVKAASGIGGIAAMIPSATIAVQSSNNSFVPHAASVEYVYHNGAGGGAYDDSRVLAAINQLRDAVLEGKVMMVDKKVLGEITANANRTKTRMLGVKTY